MLAAALPLLASGEEPTSLTLAVGEQRTLTIHGLDRTLISDPDVASVTPEGDRLRVKGSAPGATELKVWSGSSVRTLTVTVTLPVK